MDLKWTLFFILSSASFIYVHGSRCYACESRGQSGDCKDPFQVNETSVNHLPGKPISIIPCLSGWCSKEIRGIRGPSDDFGKISTRMCMTYAPSDTEERCVEVNVKNKPTLMCWCRGDLCNESVHLGYNAGLVFFLGVYVLLYSVVAE